MKSRAFKGQAAPEYAITLALVGVAGMAALALLGGSIGDAFSQLAGGMPTLAPPAAQVAAAPSTETTPATVPPPAETGTPAAANDPAPVEVATVPVSFKYDPATGKIKLSGVDSDGSGSLNTGADGTYMMAYLMQQLAETGKMPDGSPLPADISGLLKAHAQSMGMMGGSMSDLTMPASTNTSSKAYKQYYDTGIWTNHQQLSNTYNALNDFIGAHPQYAFLSQQINDYTGVTSSLYHQNVYVQYNPNATSSGIQSSLIGTNVISQPLNLNITADAISGMKQMASAY